MANVGLLMAGCTLATVLMPLSGCMHRMGDLSLMSNRNVSISMEKGNRVEGQDCAFQLGPFGGVPSLEEATDDAMKKSPTTQFLADVVVRAGHKGIGLIGFDCVEVTGTLARPMLAAPAMTPPPPPAAQPPYSPPPAPIPPVPSAPSPQPTPTPGAALGVPQ